MPKVTIIGSTGSIGVQALEVINQLGPQWKIEGLAAGNNYQSLKQQCLFYQPPKTALYDEAGAEVLREELRDHKIEVLSGEEGVNHLSSHPETDIVLISSVGFSGFLPTLSALKAGKKVALANKEALVVGGELLSKLVPNFREQIVPVDSEHSAVFQCLYGQHQEGVRKITLTASGGPFKDKTWPQLQQVTPAQALKHPNWNMGDRITIDSATLMNKGFEVLEASWLFEIGLDALEVTIHPQSIIHSMVEFLDGSVLAQLGNPDMRIPIQYSLTHPDRAPNDFPTLDLTKQQLTFEAPDYQRFPCLNLAYQAGKIGGTMPACLNAADELAVEYFLKGKISFTDIPKLIKISMEKHHHVTDPNLDDIIEADKITRESMLHQLSRLE